MTITKPPLPFTKPPLFQRNRLTGSGNPTFESCVEGKALKREIEVYSRSSFQIPHDCTHFIEAQLIRTCLVLWSPKGGSQCTQNFSALLFQFPHYCISVRKFRQVLKISSVFWCSGGAPWNCGKKEAVKQRRHKSSANQTTGN